MPTYEYRCPNGHTFEVFQRMSDEPGAPCPECGEAAERLISAGAGFLFKGDGFYITDTRSAAYKKKAEADKGGGADKKASGGSSEKASGGSSDKGGASSSGSSGGASSGGTSSGGASSGGSDA